MKTAYDIFTLKQKPFENLLRIINGTAYQHANGIWIYKKLDTIIPDGVYFVDALKLGLLRSNEQAEYFSEPEHYQMSKEGAKTILIYAEQLKKFSKYTSTEVYRPSIQCVSINENKIFATDAHKLIFKNTKFDGSLLIPANVIKLLPKNGYIEFIIFDHYVQINLYDHYIIYQRQKEKFVDISTVINKPIISTLKFDASIIEWKKHSYVDDKITICQEENKLIIFSENSYKGLKHTQEIKNNNPDCIEFTVYIKSFKVCLEGLNQVEIKINKNTLLINDHILIITLEKP